jgi:hypothetical protein
LGLGRVARERPDLLTPGDFQVADLLLFKPFLVERLLLLAVLRVASLGMLVERVPDDGSTYAKKGWFADFADTIRSGMLGSFTFSSVNHRQL